LFSSTTVTLRLSASLLKIESILSNKGATNTELTPESWTVG